MHKTFFGLFCRLRTSKKTESVKTVLLVTFELKGKKCHALRKTVCSVREDNDNFTVRERRPGGNVISLICFHRKLFSRGPTDSTLCRPRHVSSQINYNVHVVSRAVCLCIRVCASLFLLARPTKNNHVQFYFIEQI